jgi:hypothetical protein
MSDQQAISFSIQKTLSEKTLPPLEDVSRTENSFIDNEVSIKTQKPDLQVKCSEKGDKKSLKEEWKIMKVALTIRVLMLLKVLFQIPCMVFYPVYCFSLFPDFVSYCGARNLVKKVLGFALILTGILFVFRSYFMYYFVRIAEKNINAQVIVCLFVFIHCMEITQIVLIGFIVIRINGKNKVWVEKIASDSRNRFKYL